MKREDARKLAEKAIADLSQALSAGRSETLCKYLATLARFHHYSFGNIMMIYSQSPEASHVAGFNTWKKLGRNVRKGAKGIAILAPTVGKKKLEDDVKSESGGKVVCVVRCFKVVHVFDVSQTEGKELPQFASISGEPGRRLDQLRQLVKDEGITLRYEPIPGGAEGMSSGGGITVVPGLEPAEDFSVLVHELAHSLLHRGERRKETTKTVRETEAEAVSFVVSTAIGLDPSTRSSDYIQLYSGDAETLNESLDHVQRASTRILSALEKQRSRQHVAVNA